MTKRENYGALRRVLSLVMALAMLVALVPGMAIAADGTQVYLVPNANWQLDGARFAVYYWNDSGSGWADMTDTDGDGVYEGLVPAGYSNIIFCRMNPNAAANDWGNKWNQTADLTVPTDGTNCYTVAEDTWDNGSGVWSVYTTDTVLYLKPNDNWTQGGARFAIYYWNDGGNGWADMTDADGDGCYEGTVPEGYSNIIFCRMNPDAAANDWGNKWNQTADLTVPTDGTDCYVVAENTWDNGGGEWVVYPPEESGETEEPEDTTVTYIVAGVAGLCGSGWEPADTANQMTLTDSGKYEITYTNVPAGSYEFKVTDGTWNNSWGNGDANYVLTVEAVSNVTILFDADTKEITVNVVEVPQTAYYLIGWINGADYGCNGDWENLGEYKFVDGKLTATFEQDSYVFVKTGDNANWYMAESYCAASPAVLKNTTTGTAEKLYVPGGVEVTFTLVDNGDDTLTLSYTTGSTEEPQQDYYLIGYINGADYGCNDDWENLGEYKFENGKLTAAFQQDSYVFVKTGDNANWYMAESYCAASPAVLKNTNTGTAEKLYVPGGVELTFTLVDNGDDTLTLSYEQASTGGDQVEIPEGYTAVTIHFLKTEGWGSNINAYVWTAAGALAGYEDYNSWPGKAIGASAGHAGWYDLIVATETPTAFNFIFNDGGNQTADLYTGDITGDTELWVIGNDVMTTAPGAWSGDYDYTAYIHFQKPESWGTGINAYAWNDAGTILGNWPGTAIEADAINEGWYNVAVTMDDSTGFSFILNDGSSQTADLTTGTLEVSTHIWVVDGETQTTAPEGWVDPDRKIYVPGTFPGESWNAGSNQMHYDPQLGLYVYTFENVPAAGYEYKIAINGSWNENYGVGGVKDGSNYAVTVPADMDVTVYYNDQTHLSVTSVNYVFADITLSGTGIPEGTKLTDKGLTGIYSVTVDMAAGVYTDVKLSCNGQEYTFAEIQVEEDKAVTFYMDPVTGIFYCNASGEPIFPDTIYFDSKNTEYKSVFGALATGEECVFSIDSGADITSAVLVIKGVESYPMTAEETETGLRWSCTASLDSIGEYDYYFVLSNGSTVAVYGDDDGYYGEGTVSDLTGVLPYDLVVYKSGYETPDWMKNAVIYQIFPDRFFDGDETNNNAQSHARGEVDYEYVADWYTLPENPEQEAMLDEGVYKATGAYWGDGNWSNEIYGGDLQGIIQKIDYLKALGVNVIYLNPVFSSISNHRYDACDYTEIDPILGDMGDFTELVAVAEANGMHIILDGVFNHVSDDSVYFDRYYRFLGTSEKIGAYPYWAYVYDYMEQNSASQADAETAAKAYFTENYGVTNYSYTEWFKIYNTGMAGAVDNVGLRAGKTVYSYDGWWGYDSMPIIYSTNGSEYQTGTWAEEIIGNSEGSSVTQYWISQGSDGWRLDVANEVSDETWIHFRTSVKAMNSDAVIVGEIWDDATHYLLGDMYDSVMNYMFRNAVTAFAMGTDSETTTKALEKLRERYPEEAFYAMMNLVGSHDTTRILSYLDGIGDDRADKSLSAAFPTYETTSQLAKDRQYLVAFLQFTYPGAPTIYYGDEIGMVGSDDPDDRRAMEWGQGDQALVEWYAKLAAIRAAYPALSTGDIAPLDLENGNLLAYTRSDEANTLIVIGNNAQSAQTVTLEGSYVDLVTGETFTGTVPALRGVVLVSEEQAKTITVNTAALAPAYDPSYSVGSRSQTPADAVYAISGGETVKQGESISFTVDALVNTFESVAVDGTQLDAEDYTVKTGTVITLTGECTKALALGEHTITVSFNGGYAEAKFTVVENAVEPEPSEDPSQEPSEDPSEDPTEDTTEGTEATTEETKDTEESTKATTVPSTDNSKTGDESHVVLWSAMLMLSAVAIAALLILSVKQKKRA